jgi:N-acetylneuraminate synthase|tara:strand:+ start:284 stop:1348 length:1065 start_codon:yes stop_codon:yes gene_type:complete
MGVGQKMSLWNNTITDESKQKCYIIAEIGVNHNGNMELAKKMIEAAKEAGADAVKFQTFTADALVSRGTPKVKYQETTTDPDETHYEMINKLELKREDHCPLMEFCKTLNIEFISTPYDIKSAIFLNQLGVNIFKTSSADIVDITLQEYLAGTGKTVLSATGMATLGEVENAVILYREANNPNLILLHSVSNYPCTNESLNLRVIQTLHSALQVPVGFSDHSVGYHAAIIAVALGARVIEKHFTLDKNIPGPDHKASSTPEEFSEFVRAVRNAEVALGSPFKECQEEEKQMAQVSRKSIVIKKDIKAGEVLTQDHIAMKRPGAGLPATVITAVLNKTINKPLRKDHLLQWNDIQ